MILKRILVLFLILSTVLVPLSSCKEEEKKKPTKKPSKEEQTETLEETIDLESLCLGDRIRATVEIDPLFFDQDPAEDEELCILFVGNSYSAHWPDELTALLGAGGYENSLVCNIYHSGATFDEHWTWFQNSENAESFRIHRPGRERVVWDDVGLEECLTYANWDIISFQQSNRFVGSTERHRAAIEKGLTPLFGYIYAYFPQATYYWQQNWSHSAGKDGYSSTEKSDSLLKWHRQEALFACETWNFINTPLGQAWALVKYDPLFYSFSGDCENDNPTKSLHTRIYESSTYKGMITNADLSHDGNIGGGQYLNGCVWYEMITHKSVVGNPFVSEYYHEESGKTYTFTSEQIAKLQNAAHEAVLADHGEEWYE